LKVLVVFSIIRDEEFYIELAIRSVIDRAYGVYVMDTGSLDGTISIMEKLRLEYPSKIFFDRKFFGGKYRFDMGPFVKGQPPSGFDEAKARNYGFERAKQVFPDYDWILSMDADEIVTPLMFDEIQKAHHIGALQLGHGTTTPMTPYTFLDDPKDKKIIIDTMINKPYSLDDPHIKAWRKELPVSWGYWGESYHIAHFIPEDKRLVSTEEVNLHLHYGFGPKAIHGWICEWSDTVFGFAKANGIPLEVCEQQFPYEEKFPDWFVNGKFKPKKEVLQGVLDKSVLLEHPLPRYVLDKWNSWGNYEIEG
jgi:glycosyltransferase involved in cell wall biosynthesis